MRPTKLPVTLLNERAKHQRAHLLDVETFETTFGPKAQRKKPTVKFDDLKVINNQSFKSRFYSNLMVGRLVVAPSGISEINFLDLDPQDYYSLFNLLLSFKEFVSHASTTTDGYDVEKDRDLVTDDGGERDEAKEWIMFAGQSKRIWNELYKVRDRILYFERNLKFFFDDSLPLFLNFFYRLWILPTFFYKF